MECYERGLLTDADTDGIPLHWGDGATVLKLIDLVARREGLLGELLADGALAAARRLGRDSEQYVVHVKGLEVAMHDPRAMRPMLENYPISPTGGDDTGAGSGTAPRSATPWVCANSWRTTNHASPNWYVAPPAGMSLIRGIARRRVPRTEPGTAVQSARGHHGG